MVLTRYGGPEVLQMADVPQGTIGAHDVCIKVLATSVNPIDWKVREGRLTERLPLRFPAILGWDAAGIVETIGSSVTRVAVGDAVFSRPATDRPGTYAEYVIVDEGLVAPKPRDLTFLQAASIPLAGLTAWEGLVEIAEVRRGQRVLIHGGAGGVGSYAVQLAKARGAFVAATLSLNHQAYLAELGADQVVDYHDQPFDEVVDPVDVVFDTVGGETQERSYRILKAGGTLVSIAHPPKEEDLARFRVHGAWFFLEPDGNKLKRLGALFDEGLMRPQVHATFDLAQMPKAHRLSQTGHVQGKIGIKVTDQAEATE